MTGGGEGGDTMKSLWEEWNTWCEVGDKGSGDAGGGGRDAQAGGEDGVAWDGPPIAPT